ncbi:MAG: helix-turn-helix transcriptional regulator, partial [Lachnospiraceae bacterium]|nr:helix-turn-helix transcriptional regulator [Lachnospiraceae bacterium]
MYEHIGYSKRHADRLFSEFLHMTPREYVRKVILTDTAKELLTTDDNIIDIALNSGYETHEGFTRAFKKHFHT